MPVPLPDSLLGIVVAKVCGLLSANSWRVMLPLTIPRIGRRLATVTLPCSNVIPCTRPEYTQSLPPHPNSMGFWLITLFPSDWVTTGLPLVEPKSGW